MNTRQACTSLETGKWRVLSCLVYNCCWLAVCIVVVVLCVLLSSYVYLLYYVCIAGFFFKL